MQTYQHWRLEIDTDQILWLYFDKQDSTVNTLDRDTMEELDDIVSTLAADTKCRGLIITSGKKKGFIAGADISQFNQFTDVNEAIAMLRKGQGILDKIEALTIPSVALIDGFCVGGGLELALACRYRVVEDSHTKLGLPEVKLGICPGWGGSVRMLKLIGAIHGLEMVMSGRIVSGKAAAKLGFVDVCVPKRHLLTAAKYYILNKPTPRKAAWWQNITNSTLARKLIAQLMRRKLREKVNEKHYPSPFLVLNNWEQFGIEGKAPFEQEAKTCGKLFFSETSQNLVRIFFLQERLKGLAKECQFSPKHVHIVGAGTMGGDIAAWCALQGLHVTLQDREAKYIAPAIKRAYTLYKDKLKETYLIQKAMDRLVPDPEGYGISRADVIIEAIFENLSAKRDLFKELERKAKPTAILATNTSSIPLNEINTVLESPERLIGIHYFNPVAKMQLVEIVKGERTDPLVVENAIHFIRKIDKLPLPVKSSPGFLVNRILMPYLLEAVSMLDEGVPQTAIDKAMIEFGMPMGPVTLADTVGLDVCLSVAKYLSEYMDAKVPQRLIKMVEQNKLGRKSGEGFYQYKNGKQIKPIETYDKPLEDIADRLVLRILDESFACLREGVVADGDLLDAGMIFGTGFAPFRGGPIHYAKTRGIKDLFQQFIKMCQLRGEKTEGIMSWPELNEVS